MLAVAIADLHCDVTHPKRAHRAKHLDSARRAGLFRPNRREIVLPLSKVATFGDEVRLNLSASELAGFDLFGAPSLKPMPDHWPMPAGFDLRSFFLVGGDGWTAAVLPFVLTSPTVSGTPAALMFVMAECRVLWNT